MDYKYIEQLLERYWRCETSLEEEEILRMFFSQKEVPAELRRYRDLFAYEHQEVKADVLDDDFDARMMEMVSEQSQKARTISLTQRFMPLFKAAAMVAIFLTLGNAAQRAFEAPNDEIDMAAIEQPVPIEGKSVAMGDTLKTDTLQKAVQPEPIIIK
jgi:hypothetical protein